MITRTRGYLPHKEVSQQTYFVTFRLFDSLPEEMLLRYQKELEMKQKLKTNAPLILVNQYQAHIQNYLDSGHGECWLQDPRIATITLEALKKYNDQWYVLNAYTVMPNHVHVLFSLNGNKALSEIIRNWKGASAFYSNRVLNRVGIFWQREYFDKLIKSPRQFEFTIRYIYKNPVKAGLCKEIFQWPWSGSSPEIEYLMRRFFV